MNTLVALALSTPIWGFSLQPPIAAAPDIAPGQVSQVRTVVVDEEILASRDSWAESHNAAMMNWTRAFQVSTTIAFAITASIGAVQFHDEYGFHDEYYETQCGRGQLGDPVFDYCGEQTPWPHLISGVATASALLSTIGLSTAIDFDRAARRDGDWRTFETTRWIALALGVLQAGAGAFLANAQRADWLSYEEDFDLMQGLAITHMALGVVNLGMNVYNSILIF